ncbi:MAG: internal scaffolding protein [Microviridae sp.]|nr:MAG: internal scaffolding protein [Microviridae sp.]
MSITHRSQFLSSYSDLIIKNPNISTDLSFPENSPFTKQEFKNECDINVILAQYMYSGEIPNLNEVPPNYADCTGMDYMDHMNKIVEANQLFSELPSKIRNRFQNNPAEFLDFMHDENNVEEMRKMGLLRPVETVVIPSVDLPQTES